MWWLLFKYRQIERYDAFCRWLAWKLPKRLVRWTAMRVMAHSTVFWPDRTPLEISIMDANIAWEHDQVMGNRREDASAEQEVFYNL